VAAALLATAAQGQFRGGGGPGWRDYDLDPQAQKEQELMEKAIDPAFTEDVFTFARLRFKAERGRGFGGGRLWDDDSPQADLSLTFRLFEGTSLKPRPGLTFIDIAPNDLVKYPFAYAAAGGRMVLSDEDAACLRRYLLNGGFLMVDDFWGDDQWRHFYEQLKKIFPDREPVELALDHPIFRTVFKFRRLPQVPSVFAFLRFHLSYDPGWPYDERSHEPHYYAVYDDKQRMMALLCHNNHFGDGWEHETDDESYFDTFSEPMAYPMLINIVTYSMTH